MLALFLLTCSSLVLGGQISTGGCAATSSCGKGTSSYNYCYVASSCSAAKSGWSGYYDYCTPASISVACPSSFDDTTASIKCTVTTAGLAGTIGLQWYSGGSYSTQFKSIPVGTDASITMKSTNTTLAYDSSAGQYTLDGITSPGDPSYYSLYFTADDSSAVKFGASMLVSTASSSNPSTPPTCSSGSYLSSSNQCAYCPAGTYSQYGATSCTTCASGTTSTSGSSTCPISTAGSPAFSAGIYSRTGESCVNYITDTCSDACMLGYTVTATGSVNTLTSTTSSAYLPSGCTCAKITIYSGTGTFASIPFVLSQSGTTATATLGTSSQGCTFTYLYTTPTSPTTSPTISPKRSGSRRTYQIPSLASLLFAVLVMMLNL